MPPRGRGSAHLNPNANAAQQRRPQRGVSTVVAESSQPQRAASGKASGTDRVLAIVKSTPLLTDSPDDPSVSQQRNATEPIDASVSLDVLAAMLRGMYVISLTEKAQLKIRNSNLQTTGGAVGSVAMMLHPSPVKVQRCTTSATPPLSPSRGVMFTTTGGSETPSHMPTVLFTDQRWLTSVSNYVGHSVTLDHVAQLAALFPDYIKVSWAPATGGGSSPSPTTNVRLFGGSQQFSFRGCLLEELFFDADSSSFLSTATTFGSPLREPMSTPAPASSSSTRLRARLTLLCQEIPSVDALVLYLVAKGGLGYVDGVVHTSAAAQFLSSSVAAASPSHSPFKCFASNDQAATTATIAPPTHQAPEPLDFAKFADGDRPSQAEVSTASRPERKRGRNEGDDEFVGNPDHPSLSFDTFIPLHMQAFLSDAKKREVASAQQFERRAEMFHEMERIEKQQEAEKLLSLYDLVRITFGPSRRTYGGERLLHILCSQNRHGDSQKDVEQQLRRLMSFSESGLSATHADPLGQFSSSLGVDEESTPAAHNQECAMSLEDCVFSLRQDVSRNALAVAIGNEKQAIIG